MTTSDKVLLLEGVHKGAVDAFRAAGFTDVEHCETAFSESELIGRLKDAAIVGVRSRSALPAPVIEAAAELSAVGCFCIGTNHVALEAAATRGAPVFNAPFANARSVAELTMAAIVMLMRGMPEKNAAAHAGRWMKTARGSYEARAKKLGIVGYGNIGSQLSVLASGLGMHVFYYDVGARLAHGNARAVASLDELLELSDVVTLHVPSTDQTRGMIDAAALNKMKPGAFLINYARGDLVEIDALASALESGHVAGAAIDVYPSEPGGGEEEFVSPLRRFENVLLSPHIGGSTQEAQANIGLEVAEKLIRFHLDGATAGAVNFPNVAPADRRDGRGRIAHVHRNVPGVLSDLNEAIGGAGLNIAGQHLETNGLIGYAVTDLDGAPPAGFQAALEAIPATIRARIL